MTSAGRHDAVHVRASLPSPATRAGGHSTFPPFPLRCPLWAEIGRFAVRLLSALLARLVKKGRTFRKKTELPLRLFCRLPGRDQRREDPAASLLAGADFSAFSFSPLSVVDGFASLCGCASFDPV